MVKQKIQNTITLRKTSVSIISACLIVALSLSTVAHVQADEFDEKIRALTQQNNRTEGQLDSLESQAENLEQVIAKLQSRINGIQVQINENRASIKQLEGQIKEA